MKKFMDRLMNMMLDYMNVKNLRNALVKNINGWHYMNY